MHFFVFRLHSLRQLTVRTFLRMQIKRYSQVIPYHHSRPNNNEGYCLIWRRIREEAIGYLEVTQNFVVALREI